MPEVSYGGASIDGVHTTPAFLRECNLLRKASLVQDFPLFNNVPPADCRGIVSLARECEFSRHQTIFLEGDPARNFILLTSGGAKITQLGQSGTVVIVRLVGRGELVEMTRFNGQRNHRCTAQTLSDSTAFVWETSVFKALADRFSVLGRNVVDMVSQRLQELEERFREVSTESVAARLSHELVRLFKQMGRRTNGGIEINFSREELAQLTGTTLFTVSRLLSDWDNRGLMRARRETVSVQDVEVFRRLAERTDR